MRSPAWPEVDSKVHEPWLRQAIGVALVALAVDTVVASQLFVNDVHRQDYGWLAYLICGFLFLFFSVLLFTKASRLVKPTFVRHATADVLGDIPREPLLEEFRVMQRTLKQELVHLGKDSLFRPNSAMRYSSKQMDLRIRFALWFVCSGVIIAFLLRSPGIDWPVAVFVPPLVSLAVIALVEGGSRFVRNQELRDMVTLTVPRSSQPVILNTRNRPTATISKARRELIEIAREQVVAVQLCPFICDPGGDSQPLYGVQGLLVVRNLERGGYERYVLLYCADLIDSAIIMEQLADLLQVPYLFMADAEAWKKERLRS